MTGQRLILTGKEGAVLLDTIAVVVARVNTAHDDCEFPDDVV